ncbi:MAG: FKBP-type peptidyl-prolyl cis-trans isomerase [Candidatus Micrarchaeota archaeon]
MFAICGLLLFGCVNPPASGNQTNGTGYPVITNTTGPIPGGNASAAEYVLPENYTVSPGDYVAVIYALWVDGKVYDTNNATLANESGIYNPRRAYNPFTYPVEFNKGVIDGFIINTIGMRINETVTFDIDPERGYGIHDPAKVISVPRYYNKSLYETVPRSYFEERGMEVSNGTSFNSAFGPVFITDLNDENVTIFYLLQDGGNFTISGIPQTVVGMSNMTAKIEFAFEVNKTYSIPDPETGAQTTFTVTAIEDDNVTLDGNHPLAGKTLRFSVTLLDAIPASQRQ